MYDLGTVGSSKRLVRVDDYHEF